MSINTCDKEEFSGLYISTSKDEHEGKTNGKRAIIRRRNQIRLAFREIENAGVDRNLLDYEPRA